MTGGLKKPCEKSLEVKEYLFGVILGKKCLSLRQQGLSISYPRIPYARLFMKYFVYILANKMRGTLYIGITNDLIRRVYEHKHEFSPGFTRKYKIKKLVYFETYDYVHTALQREKTLKHWKRNWKIDLIEGLNPDWKDLWETIIA